MNFRFAALAAIACLAVATPALAAQAPAHSSAKPAAKADKAAKPLELTHGWVREAPPGAEVMAAYFTVKNTTTRLVRLEGVSSPLFGRVEMHTVKQQNGRVAMEEVKTFHLKPGESLTLAPGGAHLMMFEPTRALKPGEKVSFTLDFGIAGKLTTQFPVQRQAPGAPAAAPAGHGHDHGGHGHDHH